MMADNQTPHQREHATEKAPSDEQKVGRTIRRAELLPLFRILVKEIPPNHDVTSCPICKKFGITSI